MSASSELLLPYLPEVSKRRAAVKVTRDAVRELRKGSPWLFDGSITSVENPGAPGDLAVVFDDRRRFVAIGLWDPASPIRLKVLHHGEPRTIDAEWWSERVAAALERRSTLEADPDTTGYRVIHGENDGFPGLVVDRYAGTLVIKVYSAIWFPHVAHVLHALIEALSPERVVMRLARSITDSPIPDGFTVYGSTPEGPVMFRERGLVMEADVLHGNKTGHFLDQRDNRGLVRAAASGARVLDVFANTGGFSVSAAAGGATSVHLIDVSEQALQTAQRNIAHNQHIRSVRNCEVKITAGDAFEVMRELSRIRERYDIVILDPPSFAQNERSVPAAERAYFRLTQAGVALLAPGGLLVQASCSSRVSDETFFGIVHEAAMHARVRLREIRRTGHAIDHPIGFEYGAYLKAVFARVDE
jgi:23S rRNA (cytosine1962-C5)-methyltransferase